MVSESLETCRLGQVISMLWYGAVVICVCFPGRNVCPFGRNIEKDDYGRPNCFVSMFFEGDSGLVIE